MSAVELTCSAHTLRFADLRTRVSAAASAGFTGIASAAATATRLSLVTVDERVEDLQLGSCARSCVLGGRAR